ncbi:MAG: hypothetical protein ACTHN3_06750 [Solirubrobacterales bacterium]
MPLFGRDRNHIKTDQTQALSHPSEVNYHHARLQDAGLLPE